MTATLVCEGAIWWMLTR